MFNTNTSYFDFQTIISQQIKQSTGKALKQKITKVYPIIIAYINIIFPDGQPIEKLNFQYDKSINFLKVGEDVLFVDIKGK